MNFGLPFPTYLGWYLAPILTLGTTAFCIWQYVKFKKEEENKKDHKDDKAE